MSPSDILASFHWQQDLLASLEVGVVVVDCDFNVKVWNRFMENHSGKLPSAVRDKSLFSVFADIDETWLTSKALPVFELNTSVSIIWEQRPYLFKFASSRPITSHSAYMYQNISMFPLHSVNGDVEMLCMLVYDVTDQAMSLIRERELNEELAITSRTDGLTGLFNRRYWQERFEHVFTQAKRGNVTSTLMMLDIDHFKKINDTYGHQAGDKVIRELASLIVMNLRDTDIAGRYGGEEYATILSGSNAQNAIVVAERLRKLVEKTPIKHEGQVINYTISIGLSECNKGFTGADKWLESADQALYTAKHNGRNQVVIG